MTSLRVAVIGVGRMGLPIAGHLHRAGYVVRVYDRDADRTLRAASTGLRAAESAAAAAADADVLLTVLPGAPECESVMLGQGRVVESLRPGSCWLDLTSNDPRVAEEICRAAARRGIEAVGAPMGGGVEAAEASEIEFYVGGSPAARDRVWPILFELASADGLRVVGEDIGSAYAAKLLINLLWFGQVAAVSEALLLAERLGVSAGNMRELIAGSAADSAFAQRHLDRLLTGDDMATFGLRECVDELDILTELADIHRSPFEVSSVITRLHHEALERFGPVDGELMVARLLEDRSGSVLRHPPPSNGG